MNYVNENFDRLIHSTEENRQMIEALKADVDGFMPGFSDSPDRLSRWGNVIKIIVFMTKKKAHLPNTKQTGGLFSMLSWISIFDSKIPCKIRISKELKRNKHKL